jgi:hypothetical protein
MAQCTRPVCAWCHFEGHYGFEPVGYWGPVFQYIVNGKQTFLHPRCEAKYRQSINMDVTVMPVGATT